MNTLNSRPLTSLERLELAGVSLLIAICLGFPALRTIDLFSDNTEADASYAEGSILMQLMFGPAFLLAAWLVWRHSAWAAQIVRRVNPFLLLIVLWAAATVLWSPYPAVTVKRSIQLVGLMLVGITLTLPFVQDRHFIRVLCRTLTALLVASFIMVLVIPKIGVDPLREGGWRGILWHKNTLGGVACFAVLTWVNRLCNKDTDWRIGIPALLFTLLMLVMSRSSTALISAMTGIAIYLFARRRYLGGPNARLMAALALTIVGLGFLQIFFTVTGRLPTWNEIIRPLLLLLNKSPDLTGRTDLWEMVLLDVARHPVQGIGFGAFWLNVGSPSQYIIDAVNWIPLQAHNGYIDLLNELGGVGFGLFIAFLLWHTVTLFKVGHIDKEQAAIHWAFFILILISNFSESQFFNGVLFQNCLLIFSSIALSALVARHQPASRPYPMPVPQT